ncbi:MAG: NAD-dependent epimerase/dehydratase family protein, partial [Polyangia bacterium]
MALSGAHVLITGGAGFIGSHLVEHLSKSPTNRLRILDTFRRDALRPAGLHTRPNVELVEGDV